MKKLFFCFVISLCNILFNVNSRQIDFISGFLHDCFMSKLFKKEMRNIIRNTNTITKDCLWLLATVFAWHMAFLHVLNAVNVAVKKRLL